MIEWNTAWLQAPNQRQKGVIVYAGNYSLCSLRVLLRWPVARRALQFALHPAVHSNLTTLHGVCCILLAARFVWLLIRLIWKRSCCDRPACHSQSNLAAANSLLSWSGHHSLSGLHRKYCCVRQSLPLLRPCRSTAGSCQAAADSSSMSVSRLDGRAPDGKDFANYFCTYAYLYHQVGAVGSRALLAQRCNQSAARSYTARAMICAVRACLRQGWVHAMFNI